MGRFLAEDRRQGLALDKAPLMRLSLIRVGEEAYHFVLTFHHLIGDGWSWAVIFKQVFACYEAFINQTEVDRRTQRPFRDYVAWLKRHDRSEAERFWRNEMRGFAAPTPLGLDRPAPKGSPDDDVYDMREMRLSKETTALLQELTRQNKLTTNTLLQGVWALLLSAYSGESDLVYGATVSGRPPDLAGSETMVGLFINTLPVRVSVTHEAKLLPWLYSLQEKQSEVRQREYCSLTEIHGWSEVPRGLPLFESLFVFEKYPTPADAAVVDRPALATGRPFEIAEAQAKEPTHYPLTVEVAPGTQLTIRLGFDRRRFDSSTIERMLGHFSTALEEIAGDPDRPLSEFEILPAAEKHRLLAEFNETDADFPREKCFHELFELQARENPRAIAAICEGEELSYGRLNERANRIAKRLAAENVGAESIVGLLAERGLDFLAAVLGIFKAGGAYLPLDPNHPPMRLAQVIAQSRTRLVVTSEEMSPRLAAALDELPLDDRPRALLVEKLLAGRGGKADLPQRPLPANLAYVIYTSGLTGTPKGAMVEHRGMLNHLFAKITTLDLQRDDRVAQTASQCFDISVWQFFAPLVVGGRIHIIKDETARDAARLLNEIAANRITILETVPSLLSMVVEESATADVNARDLSSLRWMIPTGEALPPELCRKWLSLYPAIPLLNAYGPTECSDDVTHHVIERTTWVGRLERSNRTPHRQHPHLHT